jgi:Fic family protein
MQTFRKRIPDFALPMSSAWLLNDIAEFKGRQDLYTRQSPQTLQALREMAMVQSVESSNRIEGVTVQPERLRPLVLGQAKPKDRSEEDITGYRQALNLIHTQARHLAVVPETFQRLHKLCQHASGDAGQWKRVDNDIIELLPGSAPRVRFRCVPAKETPAAVKELCLLYRHTLEQQLAPPLIAIAALVFDFLCIHPFRDGNGRVSRLLTLLALYQHGYEVGRYISLERLVEDTKEDYYRVLQQSSARWHDGKHEFTPWLNHFLGIVRRAYTQFAERAGQVTSKRGAKTGLVEAAIESFPGPFSLAELERACPGVSRDMVRQVLKRLKDDQRVECLGRGPGATWRKRGNNS